MVLNVRTELKARDCELKYVMLTFREPLRTLCFDDEAKIKRFCSAVSCRALLAMPHGNKIRCSELLKYFLI